MNAPTPAPCPSFALIESNIDRVAERMRGAPVQDIVLVRLIKHLSAQLGAHVGRIVRPLGLNEVGFRTLLMLYANAATGLHASELSDASSETRTNMTRICDELARKGLLRRRPSEQDRRRVVLELTRRGENLIERLLPEVWRGLYPFSNALSAKEKRDLERLLKKLADAFETTR